MKVLKKLESLGFSSYEAKAYYALLRRFPANGYEISKLAQIPPSKIYEVLTKLKNRGAVLDSQSEPVLYYPVQPKILFTRIQEDTEKSIQSVLTDLASIPPMDAFDLTWNLQGTDSINTKMIELICQAEKEVFASLWPEQVALLNASLSDAVNRGVYVVTAIFGECDVKASQVVNLEVCSHNVYQRVGAKLCTVIADDTEVVIGKLAEEDRSSTGVWTKTPSLVLVTKEYVRHDIMVNVLVNHMGQEQYEDICRSYDILRQLQKKK
ncbi:TrmB family transcriptional regulator [Sporomusa sp.]|uniref:TrmB family transcriptional regulator n=1 Tax=Sporomusa sp. TaxID=2078658 RepID=UPI002B66C4B6|nr:helix-turn-helix domain-containing protein [Sporomusa sp.]HWR44247.1 helix-turn-helix domain-containing protein [Sporomusa sp.]